MVLGAFTDALLPPSDLDNVLGGLECFSDYLGQSFLVELCLFGQFHVIVANSLLEYSRNLLEDFLEVSFELGSETIEQFLHVEPNFLSIYLGNVAFHFFADSND